MTESDLSDEGTPQPLPRRRVVGAFDDGRDADAAERELEAQGLTESEVQQNAGHDIDLAVDIEAEDEDEDEDELSDDSSERPLDVTVAVDDLRPDDQRNVTEVLRAKGADRVYTEPATGETDR